MADAAEISKSAKRRAAKKARDAAAKEEEAPPPAPAPAPPAAKAKSKAEAKPKAKAEPAPAPAAQPKGKAKAEPKAAQPKAEPAKPKSEAKAKGKAKAEPKGADSPKRNRKNTEEDPLIQFDDGSGGAWEVSTGLTKKQQKYQERKEEEKKAQAEAAKAAKAGYPKGAGPALAPTNTIPGMGPAVAANGKAPKASQGLTAAPAAAVITGVAQADEGSKAPVDQKTATVKVPDKMVGRVIGPKGSNIKLLQEKTGVTRIDTAGEAFTIIGPSKAVDQAEAALLECIEKGFMSLAFDDFSENYVMVHPSILPDLIGKGGCVIQEIKKATGCEISMPEVPKDSPAGKKFKVTIAGSKDGVETAKAVINDIQMYYHSEVTHPGQVHAELDIGDWQWRYIIGKGGSEMRHIQNNYKVRVYIPREHSANKKVLVVGEQAGVERAQVYIEKVIWNAENAATSKGRGNEGGGEDYWGQEDEDEPWMKQYMFKR